MDSFWKELEGIYICNYCNFYSEEELDECPNCERNMVGVQKEFKEEEFFKI